MSIKAEISDAIKNIVREYGEPILQNRKRLIAMLADCLPDVSKEAREAALEEITSGNVDFFAPPPSETQSDSVPLSSYEEKVKEVDKLIIRIAEMNTVNMRNNQPELAKKNYKNWLIAAIIAFILTLVIAIYVNSNLTNELNNEKISASFWYNEYNESKKIWVIDVTSMKVGNYNENTRKWVSRPGEQITASQLRWLNPTWVYNSNREIWLKFYVKVFYPDGTLGTYQSGSPTGYSYQREKTIKRGNNQELDFEGFGDFNSIKVQNGIYRIELYLEDYCLYSGTVTLN